MIRNIGVGKAEMSGFRVRLGRGRVSVGCGVMEGVGIVVKVRVSGAGEGTCVLPTVEGGIVGFGRKVG